MTNAVHGNFGARLKGPNETEFRIWAPEADAVNLLITGGESHVMQRNADGVFGLKLPVGTGTRYRFEVAPGVSVPDPASRLQDGDVDDDSVVTDPNFPWKNTTWKGRPWNETVLYELHVGAFGGYRGVIRQLPRFAALGITAVELMPIAEFPGRHNWGYDGVLHYAPDASYGTPDELKTLIDTAHTLGLMVFLDVVYNHFGPSGNYLNVYAKSFFHETMESPWGRAIDFGKPQVRRFYIDNALYWLTEFRFDGLRFDAVHQIKDTPFLLELSAEIKTLLTPTRQVHLVLENENNEAGLLAETPDDKKFDAQWNDDWHHAVHVLLTGETEGYYLDFLNPAEKLARCMAEGFCYQGERSAHGQGRPRGTKSAHLPLHAFVICLQNHDQVGNRAQGERLSMLARPDALRAATLLLLLTPQIPLIFMGDEWAETRPFLYFTDHDEELAELIRRGRRQEFAHFAAFREPAQRKKIPDPNALSTFMAAIPVMPDMPSGDQAAMLTLYERALKIRATEIAPRIPGAVSAGARALGRSGIRAAWTLGDGVTLTLAANFGGEPLVDALGPGARLLSSEPDMVVKNALPPFSACAWLQKHA